MHQDERRGADPERWAQDFSWMDKGRRLGARRDEGVHEIVVLRIQEDDPEVLFVVVGRAKKVSGQEGDGLGRAQDSR